MRPNFDWWVDDGDPPEAVVAERLESIAYSLSKIADELEDDQQ